jgi:hypothetical protein
VHPTKCNFLAEKKLWCVLCVPPNSLYFVALSTHHLPRLSRFGEVDRTRGAGQRFHRVG